MSQLGSLFYSAFELTFQSDIPLPELLLASPTDAPSIKVHRRVLPFPNGKEGVEGCWEATDTEMRFFYPLMGAFVAREGREIEAHPLPNVPDRTFRSQLLGAVLSMTLHQRGLMVLHGSAVAVDGQGAIFIGDKGWGKSTTAAFLNRCGHDFLSDDVAVVRLEANGDAWLLPGFPYAKLWPDTIAALGESPDAHPFLMEGYEEIYPKRVRAVPQGFLNRPVPLRRIYVFDDGETVQVKPLSPGAALPHIIAHSFAARFGNLLLTGLKGRSHFSRCCALARATPTGLLCRPRVMEALPALASAVEEDLRKVSSLCIPCAARVPSV